MKISNLKGKNFRNLKEFEFKPHEHLNFIIGKNAQGKTSVLEAIHYLSNLKSFRQGKPHQVMRWKEKNTEIKCGLDFLGSDGEAWNSEHEIVFRRETETEERVQKTALINKNPVRSSLDYIGKKHLPSGSGFHAITFNPSDHELIRGEPQLRRNFINAALASQDPDYLRELKRYIRSLQQRNALLKQEPFLREETLLNSFSEDLIEAGSVLTHKRLEWFQLLLDYFNKVIKNIAPKQPFLDLVYESNWIPSKPAFRFSYKELKEGHFSGQDTLPSLEQIKQAFRQRVLMLRPLEQKLRVSLVGPHRDDWMFYQEKHPIQSHGSQGEVRTILLALKLSEMHIYESFTGLKPILLLDDFSSELDKDRRTHLLEFLTRTDLQVFVTSTEDLPIEGKRFLVSDGNLRELN